LAMLWALFAVGVADGQGADPSANSVICSERILRVFRGPMSSYHRTTSSYGDTASLRALQSPFASLLLSWGCPFPRLMAGT